MIDAESTGPYSSRAVPRIKEMAKALFAVYLLFTVSAALIYTLLGMNFFDAVNHAFPPSPPEVSPQRMKASLFTTVRL